MAWERRVVWSEGMMLQPQHFQQQTRYHESQLRKSLYLCQPYALGIYSLDIDRSQLKAGKISVNSGEGILPDGTIFHVPDTDKVPSALDINENHLNATVYLAVSIRRHSNTETIRDAQVEGRFTLAEHSASDVSGTSLNIVPIEVSSLNFSLRTSKDDNNEFSCIAIAKIEDVSIDGVVTLKADFIPALLNIKSNAFLSGFINELAKLTKHRIQSLASRVSVAGKSTGSEVAEYLMLQTMNRYYPIILHLEKAEHVTPFTLYEKMISLIGDMSTFVQSDKIVPTLPYYDHRQPSDMFLTLIAQLRQLFSVVLEQNSINIPLHEKKFGIRIGTVSDKTLFTSATFVLAVSADISADDIRKYFPVQVKIGAVEQIKELVNLQLPGIQLSHLAAAPREMPYQRNHVYFELIQNGEYWNSLIESGGIACHIGTNFPNLSMELWAIRSH